VWEGSVGPDSNSEAVFEFPVQSKSDFTNENPLRGYDKRKEDWPKCMLGEDCLVQKMTKGMDGGCRRAWVIVITIRLLYVSLLSYNLLKIFVSVFRRSTTLSVR
jgi:hypothetical protein